MMKNIFKLIIGCTIVMATFFSCEKDKELLAVTTNPNGLAFLKILDYAPSFRAATLGRDSFNVYVNGAKVNGSFLTYNSIFPGTTNPYLAVPAGPQSIRITVNGVLTPDSITLISLNKTLLSNAYYSFIITDSV